MSFVHPPQIKNKTEVWLLMHFKLRNKQIKQLLLPLTKVVYYSCSNIHKLARAKGKIIFEMISEIIKCCHHSNEVLEQKEAPFSTPADIIHPLLPANLQGTIIKDSLRSHLHRRAKQACFTAPGLSELQGERNFGPWIKSWTRGGDGTSMRSLTEEQD